MEFTGERFLPHLSGVIELEHVHRYVYSMPFVEGKDVLDIACGEGYGSALLARKAATVVGIDIDDESISNAQESYSAQSSLRFSIGSLLSIPVPDSSIDVITCFESIEHVTDHDQVMNEFKRILKPDGMLLLSTPNKFVYSDLTGYKNPFHPRELYQSEFETLLSRFFLHHKTVGQRVALSSIITGDENGVLPLNWFFKNDEANSSFVSHSMYFFSIASDTQLPNLTSSIYEGQSSLDEILAQRTSLASKREAIRFLILTTPALKVTILPIYKIVKNLVFRK